MLDWRCESWLHCTFVSIPYTRWLMALYYQFHSAVHFNRNKRTHTVMCLPWPGLLKRTAHRITNFTCTSTSRRRCKNTSYESDFFCSFCELSNCISCFVLLFKEHDTNFVFHVPLISCATVKRISTPEIQIRVTLTEHSPIFSRVRKAVKSDDYFRHICPYAWNNSAPTGRIFMKFDGFSKICRENSTVIKIWQE